MRLLPLLLLLAGCVPPLAATPEQALQACALAAAAGSPAPVDGCGDDIACLRRLLEATELSLAEAEAGAVHAAARAGAVDDPVAASIGAWRVYRDAECARRRDLVPTAHIDGCRIALTRARIGELTLP